MRWFATGWERSPFMHVWARTWWLKVALSSHRWWSKRLGCFRVSSRRGAKTEWCSLRGWRWLWRGRWNTVNIGCCIGHVRHHPWSMCYANAIALIVSPNIFATTNLNTTLQNTLCLRCNILTIVVLFGFGNASWIIGIGETSLGNIKTFRLRFSIITLCVLPVCLFVMLNQWCWRSLPGQCSGLFAEIIDQGCCTMPVTSLRWRVQPCSLLKSRSTFVC